MSRLLNTIDQVRTSVRPGLTAGDIAVEAFTNALWAESRSLEVQADPDEKHRTQVLELARYRDACLTLVASTTGLPAHLWLDQVRLIATEQVSA